ncbi:hypothetical protein KUV80_16885 [Fictibacillus nanhaiensis]|uniref:hypothetical protein n=1 Tax=Fictibacillus nanhaiensis TaxID=742169 RepID=UPI001C96C80B|nr:hypothetical protein [Fictibacillus nanhaiensis]MBY6038325.1 hypothetical protein [Fictibacillus nanhaiensis]
MNMVTQWWLFEMAPVSGVLRAVFYTGLLVLCYVDFPSPLQAAKIIGSTQRAFYTPVLALRLLGLRWVSPHVLSVVTKLTIAMWIAAAAGFVQPVTGVLTFLGFAFLHMVNAGALGAHHSKHSALYALLALCFSVSYDFSLDGLLAKYVNWPLLVPDQSAFTSGFAPLLLLLFLSYTIFAGGVSKLLYGGLGWLNGDALRFYIKYSPSLWPFMTRLLVNSPVLCRVLASLTVLIELSAPVAIFVSSWRVPLIVCWIWLHVGILCVMRPKYWVQMWCYLLLIVPSLTDHASIASNVPLGGAFTAVGLLAGVVLITVLIRQSEEWPFTSVPMYSNGLTKNAVRAPAESELYDRAVRAHRGQHRAWQRAWLPVEVMEDILVRSTNDGKRHRLFQLILENKVAKFVRWPQYTKVVRATAIADLAAKSADRVELGVCGPDYQATLLLQEVALILKNVLPDWERYDRIELVCRTDSGSVVIASVPLGTQEVRGSSAPQQRSESMR